MRQQTTHEWINPETIRPNWILDNLLNVSAFTILRTLGITYPDGDMTGDTLIVAQMTEDPERLCEAELQVFPLFELVCELGWPGEWCTRLA